MRESVLRDYFQGFIDESELSRDLAGSVIRTSHDVITHSVTEDLTEDFEINSNQLVRLCDAFLMGVLKPEDLELIGFALESSEHFNWETENTGDGGSRVAETINAWASPEINLSLTVENVTKFKHFLLTGEDPFGGGSHSKTK